MITKKEILKNQILTDIQMLLEICDHETDVAQVVSPVKDIFDKVQKYLSED